MVDDNYFPRGVAQGSAFCNREEERERLIKNFELITPTLVMSPRRYGKTSLVRYAAKETDLLFVETDLFVAVDAKRIEHQILMGVKKVISEFSSSIEQTLNIIREYFKKTNAQWTIGTQGINVVILPSEKADPAITIMEALGALEDLLSKKKKQAIFFIDEVQTIGEVAEGQGIEGAIRHIAQQAKHLIFVFSGSNRHLLTNMFYDKARPLYKLCDRIILDRIGELHYEKHLNHVFQKRWKKTFNKNHFEALFSLTQRHPFYMNSLCSKIWQSNFRDLPSVEIIKECWYQLVSEERQEIAKELSMLNAAQRKILLGVAQGDRKSLTGKDFLKKVDMNSSYAAESIKALQQRDYLEKLENGEYRLVDPLVSAALQLYFDDETHD